MALCKGSSKSYTAFHEISQYTQVFLNAGSPAKNQQKKFPLPVGKAALWVIVIWSATLYVSRHEYARNSCNKRENNNRPIVKDASVKRWKNYFEQHNSHKMTCFCHNLSRSVQ